MKTLDEVITAFGCFDPNKEKLDCRDCPYAELHVIGNGIGPVCIEEMAKDAVHYLVEYRACQQHMEVVEQIRQDAVRQRDAHIKALGDLKRNDPLTWDELRQMEGKPVWVEYNFWIADKEARDKSKRWCIIREFKPWHDTEIIITDNGFVLSKNEQVKDWQAYRKERTDGLVQ